MTKEKEAPPGPGAYPGVPFHRYQSWPYLNMSSLKTFVESPAQLEYERDNPRKVTDAMLRGAGGDTLAFSGAGAYAAEFCVVPKGMSRNPRHSKYQEFLEDTAKGRYVLTQDIDRAAHESAKAMRENAKIKTLLDEGTPQVSIVWDDPRTGLRCKGRLDLHALNNSLESEPIIMDMKVTGHWTLKEFDRQLGNGNMHWQAHWYCWGASEVFGVAHDQFWFAAVKDKPRHMARIHRLNPTALIIAEHELLPHVEHYAECLANDTWPTGCDEIVEADLPAWKYNEVENSYQGE